MNTTALRQKILDIAIHEKLVKQDPADESATIMLEKIRAEKAAKIKSGELKADKMLRISLNIPANPMKAQSMLILQDYNITGTMRSSLIRRKSGLKCRLICRKVGNGKN